MTGRWRIAYCCVVAVSAVLVMSAPALAADAATAPVTFSKDVAPILQEKCQQCHQPNSIAPMSLITFQDARPWARSMKQRVLTRQMPPLHIDQSVGVRKFKYDMSLSDAQIETIARWVDAGAPEGDPKDLPPAKPLLMSRQPVSRNGPRWRRPNARRIRFASAIVASVPIQPAAAE